MTQQLSGGCACGTIRYAADVDPIVMLNCHCRHCQQAGGSGYAAIMVVPNAAVQLKGAPRYHKTIGESGMAVERGFCPNCGSQVMLKLERMPDVLGLHAGSLDDPSRHAPTMDIFTTSAQPWDCMRKETEKFGKGFAK